MKGHFLSFFLSFHFGDVVSNGVLVAFCIVFLISLLDGSTGGPPVAPPGALPSFFLLPGFFFVGGEGGGSLLLRRSFRKAVEVGAGGYRVFLPSFDGRGRRNAPGNGGIDLVTGFLPSFSGFLHNFT